MWRCRTVNKYQPHIIVVSEDDANRQIANGFLNFSFVNQRRIQVLSPTAMNNKGGWKKVVEWFVNTQINLMITLKNRIAILLIDCDVKEDYLSHLNYIDKYIPDELKDRIFVLGAWDEPEKLKKILGSFEKIGEGLAKDCYEETVIFWEHEHLRHNFKELDRMRHIIKEIIFSK